MIKTIISAFIGLIVSGVATSMAAPVADDAAAKLLNRLNQLEQEVSTLRGQNQELTHHVETLKQNQKEGFLQVDERVQKLETPRVAPPTNAAPPTPPVPNPVSRQPESSVPSTILPEPLVTRPAVLESKTENALVGKVNPDSPESYYFYGTEQKSGSENTPDANKPVKPDTPPTATAVRRSDVTPSPALMPVAPITPPATSGAQDLLAGEDYNQAYKLLLDTPPQAVPAFEAFLKKYPNHPLAANAQYWLAEALYAQRNYARASDEFLSVLKNHKSSPKAPDAALKLGYTFYELKRWELARRALEDAVRYFPETNAAHLAQARLEQMTTEGY